MSEFFSGPKQLRNRHIDLSIIQLRLVGLLIITQLLSRIVVAVSSMAHVTLFERLSASLVLANWLPLLPLGVSLYLLAGGHLRQKREPFIITALCQSLRPLALVFLGLIPVLLIWQLKAAQAITVFESLSPYQQDLINPIRTLTAILLSVLTGIGFVMLHRQMQSVFKRYDSSPQSFFRSRRVRLKTGSQI